MKTNDGGSNLVGVIRCYLLKEQSGLTLVEILTNQKHK